MAIETSCGVDCVNAVAHVGALGATATFFGVGRVIVSVSPMVGASVETATF